MLQRLMRDLERLLGSDAAASQPADAHAPAWAAVSAQPPHRHRSSRTMIHARIDADKTRALRHALMAACGSQVELMRFVPHGGSSQVRLSLCLQTPAVDLAMRTIRLHAPAAEFGRIVELPETPSSTWLNVSLGERATAAVPASGKHQTVQADLFRHLLAPEAVRLDVELTDKLHLFDQVAELFSRRHAVEHHAVYDGLIRREKLGSTALGHGVAVPHARVAGLAQAGAVYMRLTSAIPYDAPDNQPVADILALLVPEQANELHLQLLAKSAQIFSDKSFRTRLHQCHDAAEVCRLFVEYAARES